MGARLGLGGMAEVFAGELIGTEAFARPVAIKRILPGYAQDAAFVAQFSSEAQLTARLRHPNIVETLDFSRDADGGLVLVMELVQGVTLAALMAAGPVPAPVAAFLVAEMLRGLGHAHAQRLVHRDVSPHNVLLSWDGAVKVSDFGIAKARDASEASASVVLKGKPAYMSPEQASAKPLDERSDLFAVGVVLWELLANRSLFKADDTRATLAAVLFGTVPQPGGPKDLARVAMKLLEKDREKRYASADAVLADLARYPQGEQGRRALVEHLSRAFSGELASPPPPRTWLRWLIVAVLSIAMLAIVIVPRFYGDEPEPVASPPKPFKRELSLTPRDDSRLLVSEAKRAGFFTRDPIRPLPANAPRECAELVAAVSNVSHCGKMTISDRFQFNRFAAHVEEFVREWSPKAATEEIGRACRNDLTALGTVHIEHFVDCERSMGDEE